MTITMLFIYLIASIILFVILNILEKNNIKYTHYSIIIAIYILVLSGICSSFNLTKNNDSIFIIFIFELLIRITYMNTITETSFIHDKNFIRKYFLAFILVSSLNIFLISKVNNVFLNIEQTKIVIWFLIILYGINFMKNPQAIISKQKKNNLSKEQKEEYIVIQYAKLKNKYSSLVKTRYIELIPIIYAIMIHENKSKPEIFRKLDYYKYKLDGKANKFGIMQIYSKYYIDDENSISIAIRRLENIYYNQKNKTPKNILNEYYKKDNKTKDILFILNQIKKFNRK